MSWYDGKRQHTGQQVPNQYKIVFLLKNSTKSVYFGEIAKKQYGTVKTVRNGSTELRSHGGYILNKRHLNFKIDLIASMHKGDTQVKHSVLGVSTAKHTIIAL